MLLVNTKSALILIFHLEDLVKVALVFSIDLFSLAWVLDQDF